MALSIAKIRALQPKLTKYSVTDAHGLRLLVLPSGTRAWIWRYRLHGRAGEINLGRFPQLSLASARERRTELLAGIKKGLSPTDQQRAEKLAQERGETVEIFSARYLDYLARKNKEGKSIRQDIEPVRRYLTRDVYPVIGSKLMAKVQADDLRGMIFQRVEENKPQSALALRNLLKRLWDYALVRGVVDKNPLHAIPAKFVASVSSRNRALNPNEIAAFLRALDATKMRADLKTAIKLILLCCTRKGETRLAEWKEFDLENWKWEIPESHSKTSAQIVYLSRQAVELLRALWITSAKMGCVFPMRGAANVPISAATLNDALARVPAKIAHFTVHDLRRSAATNLSEQGYAADVIEKALNHKIKGVRGVYNRAQYADQRRAMLQAWADWLDEVSK